MQDGADTATAISTAMDGLWTDVLGGGLYAAIAQLGIFFGIELAPGAGVNISFIPTGETVEKVWLDNPAIATLDADGCLSSLAGAEQPSGRQCDTSAPVSVLHLRQINPLIIPGLPKSRTALLTAITNGPHGRRIYLFRVTTGKSPSYNTVEVIPLLPAVTSTNTLEPQQQARSVKADWLSWQRVVARRSALSTH
ncbi:MAG: hypothetical protein VKL59_21870 [Nostocaceae cyanobacterium]|nr:hypothetical protein [Nostocaceae cyanobacterium]